MIITRTPLRVSFLGGGSDYPQFFKQSPGFVLGTTINKYVYVFSHPLPSFASERFRFTYRITESVLEHSQFNHPVMRATLGHLNWGKPTNFATMSDLPGSSGLGSSSSFTVGLLRAIAEDSARKMTKNELANLAVKIEREIIGEPGGYQDQFHAAYGGFKLYKFEDTKVEQIDVTSNMGILNYLSGSMVLVPMISDRDSGEFAKETIKNMESANGFNEVKQISSLAQSVGNSLTRETNQEAFLEALANGVRESWYLKCSVSKGSKKFSDFVDELIKKGALAGKLCGAGGSGFILALVKPNMVSGFIKQIQDLNPIQVKIELNGSETLFTGQ